MLIRAHERGTGLERRPKDGGGRVHHRVETALLRALHETHKEALIQVGRQAPGEDDRRRVLHQVLEAPGELPSLGGAHLGAVLVDFRLRPRHRVYDRGRGPGMLLDLDEIEGYGSLGEAVADRISVAPAGEASSQDRDTQSSEAPGHVYSLAAC